MEKQYLLADFGVTKHEEVLENGLRVVFLERPFSPIFAQIVMRAGSVFDPANRHGLSHFTEHIIANGSKSLYQEKFWDTIVSVGGHWNARTSKKWMAVECEVATRDHLENMRQYFTHALSEIYVTEEAVAKEQSIIVSEIERANSDEKHRIRCYLEQSFAGERQDWGHYQLGTIESVNSITVVDVENFFNTYCCVENMVLVIAGGCTWNDIEKTFGDISFLRGSKHELPSDPEYVAPAKQDWYEMDIPETRFIFGFHGPLARTREDYLIDFAFAFSHHGLTSLFYRKLRNELALTYEVRYSSHYFNTVGYLGTIVGIPSNKISEAIEGVESCYKEFITNGLTVEQIETKRRTMWYSTLRSMEETLDWVNAYRMYGLFPEDYQLFGPFPNIHNYRKTFTAEEINDTLQKYLILENAHKLFVGRK